MTDDLPTPDPVPTPETAAFWEATREHRLLVTECTDCGFVFHYPRARCPSCASDDTREVDARGTGTIYSYTVTEQTGGVYADATPFVLAYVELDEGPRILTNITDADLDALEVGQPVEVVFHAASNGMKLPRFTPR